MVKDGSIIVYRSRDRGTIEIGKAWEVTNPNKRRCLNIKVITSAGFTTLVETIPVSNMIANLSEINGFDWLVNIPAQQIPLIKMQASTLPDPRSVDCTCSLMSNDHALDGFHEERCARVFVFGG